jgi:hypothetical protein
MRESPTPPSSVTKMTTIFASRNFDVSVDGKPSLVSLEIGKPIRDAAGGADDPWRCAYRIAHARTVRVGHGSGADSLQALMDALSRSRSDLVAIARHIGGTIRWPDQDGLIMDRAQPAAGA